ncbi:hypothetical protein Lal_00025852 [Lupinus albus]|nr:hypothetical protein Lal_00025852 [Lupinus albus]
MEEVWKDINLACLNEHNTRPTMSTRGSTFGGVIFQDFLSIVPSSNTCSNFSSSNSCSLYSTAPPTPVTALSLSCSPPEFLFDTSMDSHLVHHQYPNPNPNVTKAYTKELQLKVERLMEENARLKSQQQQIDIGLELDRGIYVSKEMDEKEGAFAFAPL